MSSREKNKERMSQCMHGCELNKRWTFSPGLLRLWMDLELEGSGSIPGLLLIGFWRERGRDGGRGEEGRERGGSV